MRRQRGLSRLLAEQGTDVVCATHLAVFIGGQRWNRENIPHYREIYLRVPIDELYRWIGKGMGQRGDACYLFVGLDVPAEVPRRRISGSRQLWSAGHCSGRPHLGTECDKARENPAAANPGRPLSFKTKGRKHAASTGAAAAQLVASCPKSDRRRLVLGPGCVLAAIAAAGVQIVSVVRSSTARRPCRKVPGGALPFSVSSRSRRGGQLNIFVCR